MNITKNYGADICRDGGSYSFSFESDDGKWYELFVQTRVFEDNDEDYYPPAMYLEGCNGGELIKTLSWAEAELFLSKIDDESKRFKEMFELVSKHAKIT